jgi:hypothetical protein
VHDKKNGGTFPSKLRGFKKNKIWQIRANLRKKSAGKVSADVQKNWAVSLYLKETAQSNV